jgi:hypothetical protein
LRTRWKPRVSPSPTAQELLDQLAIEMWKSPLAERWHAGALAEPAQTVLLVLAFDTEVQMNGLLGFLENRTGALLPEVTRAFETIGARDVAATLQAVAAVLAEHGVTHAQLRADLDALPLHAITSFDAAHDERARRAAGELEVLADALDLPAAMSLLETYVGAQRGALLAALAR